MLDDDLTDSSIVMIRAVFLSESVHSKVHVSPHADSDSAKMRQTRGLYKYILKLVFVKNPGDLSCTCMDLES